MDPQPLSEADRDALLEIAERSIRHGLEHSGPLVPRAERFSPPLAGVGASFVTLERHGELRGCVGSMEPVEPLVVNVARNAFRSAFADPRFPPLEAQELAGLGLHISVLGPTRSLAVGSRQELLGRLRPGVDGLVLLVDGRRATFLPSVWAQVADADEFLDHLLAKAGLPTGFWSERLRFERYEVVEFGRPIEPT